MWVFLLCYGQGQEDGPLRGNNEDTEKCISTVDIGQSWYALGVVMAITTLRHIWSRMQHRQDRTDEAVEKDLNQVKNGSDKTNMSYCVVSRAR